MSNPRAPIPRTRILLSPTRRAEFTQKAPNELRKGTMMAPERPRREAHSDLIDTLDLSTSTVPIACEISKSFFGLHARICVALRLDLG